MSYEVKWHTENAIVLVQLSGELEILEFAELDRHIVQHIEQSPRILVHVWIDAKEVTQFPTKIRQVFKALTHKQHERLGWSIVITSNRMVQFLGYMITQLSNKARFRAFSTDEEAQSFLMMVDANLASKLSS